jgi:SAM-dependent methyltransferase
MRCGSTWIGYQIQLFVIRAKAAARATIDYLAGGTLDLLDTLKGQRKPLTPPRRLWGLVTARHGDFHAAGANLRDFLIGQGLQRQHRLLDVGCGIGRLALALTDFLEPPGGYDGFDIMPVGIRWCQRITQAYPHFRFQLADVHSARYHPRGTMKARDYVFPYDRDTFHFVVLSSVFSHMLPDDLAHYLTQIARVLRPGGRTVISCYLVSARTRDALTAGRSALTFSHAGPGYWAEFAGMPEAAIAYDESWMRALHDACGLEIVQTFDGDWSTSRSQGQDLVIATKR